MGGLISNPLLLFVAGFGCDDLLTASDGWHDHTLCDIGVYNRGESKPATSVFSYHGAAVSRITRDVFTCEVCKYIMSMEDRAFFTFPQLERGK